LTLFEEIYTENYSVMSRVAAKLLGDQEVGSDVVQDIFIDLFQHLENDCQILNLKGWLYRAIYNRCIDNLRRQKRFKMIQINAVVEESEDILEQEERKTIIQNTLSKMKPREKSLLVFYSEGLSYREISDVTGIRLTSVGKMLSRALKNFEHELKRQGYELH